jgi:hypothetical protein
MHSCDIYCVGILGSVFLWTVLSVCFSRPFYCRYNAGFSLYTNKIISYGFFFFLVSFVELCLQAVHNAEFARG